MLAGCWWPVSPGCVGEGRDVGEGDVFFRQENMSKRMMCVVEAGEAGEVGL